jgi:hypothetical protein
MAWSHWGRESGWCLDIHAPLRLHRYICEAIHPSNQLSPQSSSVIFFLSKSNSLSVRFQMTNANGWEIHVIYKWERSQGACTAECSIAVLFGEKKLNRRAIHIEDLMIDAEGVRKCTMCRGHYWKLSNEMKVRCLLAHSVYVLLMIALLTVVLKWY